MEQQSSEHKVSWNEEVRIQRGRGEANLGSWEQGKEWRVGGWRRVIYGLGCEMVIRKAGWRGGEGLLEDKERAWEIRQQRKGWEGQLGFGSAFRGGNEGRYLQHCLLIHKRRLGALHPKKFLHFSAVYPKKPTKRSESKPQISSNLAP